MFKRKPSADLLIKSTVIFVLLVLSIIGIIFGSIRVTNNATHGASYQGAISTTVYFSPYEDKDPETQSYKELDYTKPARTYPNATLMSSEEISSMLQQISQDYANRLYVQGFNQVDITATNDDSTASSLSDVHPSWLLPDGGLPSLTITVNKTLQETDAKSPRTYDQEVVRKTLFDIARNYNISLQTTDGHVIFSSDSNSFIRNSIQANQPVSTTSNDSTISFELNLPGSTINTAADGALKYIDEQVPTALRSDYNSGNGQASVEAPAGTLFSVRANGNSTQGNGDVVLWNDKAGALAYVRYIYDVTKDSNEWNSLSDKEQSLWNFLHKEGDYSGTSNTNLVNRITSASDITLANLYYIYAVPKALFEPNSDGTTSDTSTAVSNPSDTRTSRGGSTDFSELFSPYILYEARVKDVKGTDISENTTLQSLFPINQQFSYGGNTKVVISQVLNSTGSYANLDYAQATKLATLLKNGIAPQNVQIFGAKANSVAPVFNSTLSVNNTNGIDAFGSSILALGIILLLVGIIVSILYKIPGLFNFVAIFLSAVLTFLLYTVFGGEIDLFSFFGLFTMLSVGIGCLVLINETFRRNVRNSTSLVEASRLAFNSTFMKVVDVHLITLVLGLFLMYLGHYQERALGIILLVGSFCSFFITYGLSTLMIKIFMATRNWRNYKLFVYRRDAKWLNKITGQIDFETNRLTFNQNSTTSWGVDNLSTFFNHNYKLNFLSKKMLVPLVLWVIVLVLGITTLVLFSQNIIFNLTAINMNSGLVMFIAAIATFGIGLVYFALRYRWIIMLPYLICGIINFFGIMTMAWIFNDVLDVSFEFEDILFLFIAWTLGQVSVIFSITWNYNYWYSYVMYSKQSVEKLISNNINSGLRLFVINWSVLPFCLIIFAAFNFGGNGLLLYDAMNNFLFILFGISILSILIVNVSALYLFSQLLGLMMLVRQKIIKKLSQTDKTKKTDVEYDRVDEQLIPGINQKINRR